MSEDKEPALPEQREEAVSAAQPAGEPAPATSADAGAPAGRSGGGAAVAWLALLLVLVLGGGAAWLLWQAQERETDLLQRLAALEENDRPGPAAAPVASGADVSGLRAEVVALERQFGSLQPLVQEQRQVVQQQRQVLQEQTGRLQALETQLGEQRSELAKLSGGDQDSWLLAEVEYLLRLANQRLIMAGDAVSARGLLQSADTILRQLEDVSLHPVRRAVAGDIAALRALPEVDTEGLYLRLAAVVDQVAGLVIFELPEREAGPPAGEAGDWQQRLRQGYEEALATLSRYVTVRRRDVPLEALVDPQWEALLRQNLVMLLQQAQVALLSGNQPLYHASLQRARRWLAEYYLADESATAAAARELDDLAAQVIAVELPDISGSLRELDAVTEQRLQRSEGE
ncbi:MAG: uroporphyrinogen-III C-methyltransferase [Haliea sp.]|uniref:uroporphyrinogen-III C-methyltransferase n=1 Tax=Haliea sp. TaxID=1932666 RepID=UPI0032EFF1A8